MSSDSNYLTLNIANGNHANGIILSNSTDNTLTSNTANNNLVLYGIYLTASGNNILRNNTMSGNALNFGLDGTTDQDYVQDIDTTNKVNGKSIIYLRNTMDSIVDSSSNAGTVYVINGTNVTLRDLQLNQDEFGVYLRNTTLSNIENVSASLNIQGIEVEQSNSNNISGSNTSYNRQNGIFLINSNNNNLTNDTSTYNTLNGISLDHSDANNLTGTKTLYNGRNGVLASQQLE